MRKTILKLAVMIFVLSSTHKKMATFYRFASFPFTLRLIVKLAGLMTSSIHRAVDVHKEEKSPA